MKNLLAACTTALRAARLEYGGKSATRHARKHLRISNQTVVRKAGSALLAAVLAVGMVGAAVVVPAASASNVVSDQNDPSYWQALYPGSTCTKPVDSLNVSYYKLPALPSGTDYVAVIVKAGSPQSVDEFNTVFDANSTPKPAAGVTVSTSTGKDISHIIVCTITPAVQTVVTPVTPDVTQASTCGVYGTVTAKVTTGVNYVVTFNKLTGVWTVTATPASSAYKFDGESQTVTFSGNVGAYVECPTTPTVVVPTAVSTAISCGAEGSYTLGAVEGVVYKVNGTVQQPGTYFVSDTSTVMVTATAVAPKYKLALNAPSTFPLTFTAAKDCQLPPLGLLTPKASSTPLTCDTAGSYTLVNDEGLIWLVDGVETPAGTYGVSQASTVRVVATTDPTKAGLEAGAQTEWTFTFAKSGCQLTTLALPGSNGTLAFTGSNGTLSSGLLLGLLFMVFGAGAMTVSNVRRRTS